MTREIEFNFNEESLDYSELVTGRESKATYTYSCDSRRCLSLGLISEYTLKKAIKFTNVPMRSDCECPDCGRTMYTKKDKKNYFVSHKGSHNKLIKQVDNAIFPNEVEDLEEN